jgi:uncharacterized membrane protein YcaP (DUF421 family)
MDGTTLDLQTMFIGDSTLVLYVNFAIRTVVMTLFTGLVYRYIGQRKMGVIEFSLFDFIMLILVGAVAAYPIVDIDAPLLPAMATIVVLVLLDRFMLWLMRSSRMIESALVGGSLPLINDGQINHQAIEKARISPQTLNKELRHQGIENIRDVQVAHMEPDGKISVSPIKEEGE